MSTSINNVKVWDPKKFECLLNIKKEYSHTYFTTACFYEFSENEIYIITGSVPMNVYDLNGKKIKDIIDKDGEDIFFITQHFNIFGSKIVTGNATCCKSFYFYTDHYHDDNFLYKEYIDNESYDK